MKHILYIILTTLILNGCNNTSIKHRAELLSITPYTFKNQTDSLQAELGVFSVPTIRQIPDTSKLKLTFMRIKGQKIKASSALFFLEGGPGAAAIKPSRFDLYKKLSEFGDVIILDQRGTGRSEPDLTCPVSKRYDPAQAITAKLALELQSEIAKACKKHLEDKGINLNAYNTLESAYDVNDLRELLGYEKMVLVGMSYGSHLGLAIIRYFQAFIDKAILAGVEGYDHTFKLPSTFDAHLQLISDLIRKDSFASLEFPDFNEFVKKTAQELENAPVEVIIDVDGANQKIVITSFLFKQFIAGMIGRRAFISTALSDFRQIQKGDYSSFALGIYQAYFNRNITINPLSHCMDCASNASMERLKRIEQETRITLLGEVTNFPFPNICEAWNVEKLPEHFRAPLNSKLPVLFISGSLDGRTPYENVTEIRQGFPNCSIIIIEQMGHNTNGLFLQVEEVMKEVEAFLNGQFTGEATFSAPAIQFE